MCQIRPPCLAIHLISALSNLYTVLHKNNIIKLTICISFLHYFRNLITRKSSNKQRLFINSDWLQIQIIRSGFICRHYNWSMFCDENCLLSIELTPAQNRSSTVIGQSLHSIQGKLKFSSCVTFGYTAVLLYLEFALKIYLLLFAEHLT